MKLNHGKALPIACTQRKIKNISEMLREYYQYCIAINAGPESFPSEELVLALISSQYKSIITTLL
jgi:hypothetical protein